MTTIRRSFTRSTLVPRSSSALIRSPSFVGNFPDALGMILEQAAVHQPELRDN